MELNKVDIKENAIASLSPEILRILLKDKSREYEKHKRKDPKMKTGIIWATSEYAKYNTIC